MAGNSLETDLTVKYPLPTKHKYELRSQSLTEFDSALATFTKVQSKTDVYALVDADILLYRACAGLEQEVKIGDQVTYHFPYTMGVEVLNQDIETILENLAKALNVHQSAIQLIFCFTSTEHENIRKAVYDGYKQARNQRRNKPCGYYHMLDWFRTAYPYSTIMVESLEADDVICNLAFEMRRNKVDCVEGFDANTQIVIVSEDKDMRLSVSGARLVDMKGNSIPASVKKGPSYNCLVMHLYQSLIGDAADGYPGLPGVGPVKAQKLIDKWFESFYADEKPDASHKQYVDLIAHLWDQAYQYANDECKGADGAFLTAQAQCAWMYQMHLLPVDWSAPTMCVFLSKLEGYLPWTMN